MPLSSRLDSQMLMCNKPRGDRIQMQIMHGSAGLQSVGHSAFLSSSRATHVVGDLGTLTTRVPEDLTMN